MKYEITKPFVAIYNDGSYFQQPLDDTSKRDPKKSAFYDVDHSKLVAFFIADEEHSYLVDLQDGHFAVDGVVFYMHNIPLGADSKSLKFELIYFRQVDQHLNIGTGERGVDVVYQLGWRTKDINGQEHQRVMEVK